MRIHTLTAVLILALCFRPLDIKAETKSLDDQLQDAVLFQDVPKIKDLLSKGAKASHMASGRPILGWAAQSGNTEIVQVLVDAKADINAKDEGIGHTPLMRAVETGYVDIVNVLLKAKSDPNAKEPDGETVLIMAVKSRKPEIVSALIKAGADVKYVTPDGDTPALIAAQDNMPESVETIKILGQAKADMNVSNLVYTPLSYAVEQGNKEIVTALLDAGADPNVKTQSGRAPLLLALDKPEIIELLISRKADPNLTDDSGGSALIGAIENGSNEAVAALIKAGADVNKADAYGNTPLKVANNYSKTEIAELLKKNGATE